MTLPAHDRAALAEAVDLIHDVEKRHTLELSGAAISTASLAVLDIERFRRMLEAVK